MSVFIIRRLLQSSLVIVAMSLIVFFSVNVIGNPVDILINPEFDQEEMDRAIKALGLDLRGVERRDQTERSEAARADQLFVAVPSGGASVHPV